MSVCPLFLSINISNAIAKINIKSCCVFPKFHSILSPLLSVVRVECLPQRRKSKPKFAPSYCGVAFTTSCLLLVGMDVAVSIETKAGNNKPTALQERELKQIRDAGGVAFVINETNLDELITWLDTLA